MTYYSFLPLIACDGLGEVMCLHTVTICLQTCKHTCKHAYCTGSTSNGISCSHKPYSSRSCSQCNLSDGPSNPHQPIKQTTHRKETGREKEGDPALTLSVYLCPRKQQQTASVRRSSFWIPRGATPSTSVWRCFLLLAPSRRPSLTLTSTRSTRRA